MKIKLENQIFEIKSCTNLKSRFLGMMGKKKLFSYGLYFSNCSSLHTCFMRQNIDIIMVDKNFTVVAFYSQVKPWHFIHCKKAEACFEFSTGLISSIAIGSKIDFIENEHK